MGIYNKIIKNDTIYKIEKILEKYIWCFIILIGIKIFISYLESDYLFYYHNKSDIGKILSNIELVFNFLQVCILACIGLYAIKKISSVGIRLLVIISLFYFAFGIEHGVSNFTTILLSCIIILLCLFLVQNEKNHMYILLLCIFIENFETEFMFIFFPVLVLYIDKNFTLSEKKKTIKKFLIYFLAAFIYVCVISCVIHNPFWKSLRFFTYGKNYESQLTYGILSYLIFTTLLCKEKRESYICKFTILYYFVVFHLFGLSSNSMFVSYMFISVFIIYYLFSFKRGKEIIQDITNNIIRWKGLLFTYIVIVLSSEIVRMHYISNPRWNEHKLVPYYIDYFHFGFVQRGLIGTLFYLIFGYDLSMSKLMIGSTVLYLGVGAVIIWIFKKIYIKTKSDKVLFVILIYLASTTFTSFFETTNARGFDLINLMLVLLCMYFLLEKKGLFMIPVLCCIGVLIHQIFIVMIFPLLCACFMYAIISGEKSKKILIWFIITLFLVSALFVYIQFYSNNSIIMSYNEAYSYLIDRSSGGIYGAGGYGEIEMLDAVLYVNTDEHFKISEQLIGTYEIKGLIGLFIYLIPVFVTYLYIIFKDASKRKGVSKILIGLIGLFDVMMVPCYFESDYGRWNRQLIGNLILYLLFVLVTNKGDCEWWQDVCNKKRMKYLFVTSFVLVLWMAPFAIQQSSYVNLRLF